MIKIALQMYSLREETPKDFFGALAKVAEFGYSGVEFAGYGGIGAREMRAELDRLGLSTISVHHGYGDMLNGLDELIEYNKVLGNDLITCAGGAPFASAQDIADNIEGFKRIAEQAGKAGMRVAYHNHSHEFVKFPEHGGKYAYDVMMEALDGLVGVQLDVYWLFRGGVNIPEYLNKYGGRMTTVHIKDGDANEGLPVGTGVINLKETVDCALANGVNWFIIEDESQGDQFSYVKLGLDNLKKAVG